MTLVGAEGTVDLALVRRLERASLLAVPAEQEWEVGGWVCRWGAEGRVGRVASATASPFAPEGSALAAVDAVAASYAARGLPALVRLTPLAPPGLPDDPRLRPARAPVVVMTRGLGDLPAGAHGAVELSEDAGAAWRAAFLAHHEPVEGRVRLALAEAAPRERRFASLTANGEVAGMALGVVAEGALGLFDVLTAPAHRRRGVATAVVAALLAWGREAGADVAYLQVAAANGPALALYARLGFRPAYRYSYASLAASPA